MVKTNTALMLEILGRNKETGEGLLGLIKGTSIDCPRLRSLFEGFFAHEVKAIAKGYGIRIGRQPKSVLSMLIVAHELDHPHATSCDMGADCCGDCITT